MSDYIKRIARYKKRFQYNFPYLYIRRKGHICRIYNEITDCEENYYRKKNHVIKKINEQLSLYKRGDAF